MDLVEFLNARLDEEEASIRYHLKYLRTIVSGEDLERALASQHRALRDVEAKRAILAAYAEVAAMDCDDPEPEYAYGRAAGLGEAVRHLAAVDSDHPDYDAADS